MSIELNEEVIELLDREDSVKVLATSDEDGTPYAVVRPWLHRDGGKLVYLEPLESSRSNRNLVHALWFDRKVTVTVSDRDGRSWQIKGFPIKAHVCGPVFRRYYEQLRRLLGDVDLAAVWLIEPQELSNETLQTQQRHADEEHPFFRHLDRLTRQEATHA
ncbi:MAG: pyridoxamine 5'-phosphate oxidase family protein [Bacillota bacterium]